MLPTRRRTTHITTRRPSATRTVAKVTIFAIAAYVALKVVTVVLALAVTLVATVVMALFVGVLLAALVLLMRR